MRRLTDAMHTAGRMYRHTDSILLLILTTHAKKQTSGDPSGQTRHYSGITLL